jgi:hypothetical protein
MNRGMVIPTRCPEAIRLTINRTLQALFETSFSVVVLMVLAYYGAAVTQLSGGTHIEVGPLAVTPPRVTISIAQLIWLRVSGNGKLLVCVLLLLRHH